MERVLSEEEKIRRAEAIYNSRKNNYQKNENNVSNSKKNRIIRKLLYQIFICIIIYALLFYLKQIDGPVINEKIKEYLNYDIDLTQVYSTISSFIKNNKIFENEDNTESNKSIEEDVKDEKNNDETLGIGGAIEETETVAEENDIDYIKNNYKIIWPLNGTITSKFGPRTPTEIVSANHKGIDIAGNVGEEIIAGMDGVVKCVSEEGDYGKHIEIINNDITTLYAHCSKLLVSEGDEIKQGQVIAEVGQTGRATGPHLHFEIRRNDIAIDPELII